MISAPVGDDVKEEDPTVKILQEKVARLCGKEDALFVCSGVMSNQIALRTLVTQNFYRQTISQCVLIDARSHIYKYELGGLAFHSGVQAKAIQSLENGQFITADIIEKNLNFANDYHNPVTTIISLENTQNGSVYPIEEIKKIRALADRHDIKMHLDGARLWNACAATDIDMATYAQYFDSISLCLSKGLGSPIGSVLVGSKEFILKARQYRKLFGGGMRQVGNIAACGIYAIEHNWPTMKTDHENTKILYQGLIKLGFEATVPETNMIFVNTSKLNMTIEDIIAQINEINKGEEDRVLIEGAVYGMRLVVHFQTPLEGVQKLLQVLERIVKNKK